VFHGVDQSIERRGIHQSLLDQQRFQSLDPECQVRGNILMIVVVILCVDSAGPAGGDCSTGDTFQELAPVH
jgi:hypothetical protein